MSDIAAPARLGLGLKIAHGFGSTAFGVAGLALSGGLLQLYFNQVLGLPAIWVGTVIMATIVVDAVIDPLIGRWSDHLRSPLGRRHTFMYASAIPSALAFYILWRPPAGLDPPMLLAFMAAALIFVRIAISFYEIPSTSLGPELATDPHDRTSLFAWRFVFLVVGGAVLNAVLYQGFLAQDADNPQGMLNPDAYKNFGLVIGLFVFVTILASTGATHHRIRTLHTPPMEETTLKADWAEVRAVFTYRPLLLIVGAAVLHGLAAGTFDGLSGYFNLHFWELRPQDIGMVWIWGTVSAVFALAAAPWLSKRLGKPRSVATYYLLWLASATVPPLLRLAGAFPENGSPALLPTLIVNFIVGVTCLIAATATIASMVADAVDVIAERSGRRSEGVTFAIKGVLDKWAIGLGAFAAGAIVTFVDFPARAVPGTVDPAIINKLAYVYLPLAIAANLLAVFLISRIRTGELGLPAAQTVPAAAG